MKVLIGAILFACLATALMYALSRSGRKLSGPVGEGVLGTTQNLITLVDFDGPYAVRRDGAEVAFLDVSGKSFEFLTPEQKDLAAADLEAAFAATDYPFTIHRVTKPVDPSEGLHLVLERIRDVREREEAARKIAEWTREERGRRAAQGYERRTKALRARRELLENVFLPRAARAPESYEIKTYATLVFPPGSTVAYEAKRAISSFEQRFAEAGYEVRLMSPTEIEEALINYYGRFPSEAEASEAAHRAHRGFGSVREEGRGGHEVH